MSYALVGSKKIANADLPFKISFLHYAGAA